jgi:hypothetical protein
MRNIPRGEQEKGKFPKDQTDFEQESRAEKWPQLLPGQIFVSYKEDIMHNNCARQRKSRFRGCL